MAKITIHFRTGGSEEIEVQDPDSWEIQGAWLRVTKRGNPYAAYLYPESIVSKVVVEESPKKRVEN